MGEVGGVMAVLLSGIGLQHVVDDGLLERCWLHEEAGHGCSALYRILRG